MPITTAWQDSEETIFRIIIDGKWEWQEMEAAHTAAFNAISSKNQRTHLVYDATSSGYIPVSDTLGKAAALVGAMPENVGYILVVTNVTFARLFIDALTKAPAVGLVKKLISGNTLNEALEKLKARLASESPR
ncbi:MAG: hypothetical protein IPK19_41660 [Chloroflexi bacterium]|nr:hypothetical protein [Chloroflexota bacterium]